MDSVRLKAKRSDSARQRATRSDSAKLMDSSSLTAKQTAKCSRSGYVRPRGKDSN